MRTQRGEVGWDGKRYPIPDNFSNRELMEIERIGGQPFGAAERNGYSYGVLVGLLMVSAKRAGMVLDLDEVLDGDSDLLTRLTAKEVLERDAAEANPTPGEEGHRPDAPDAEAAKTETPAAGGASGSDSASD